MKNSKISQENQIRTQAREDQQQNELIHQTEWRDIIEVVCYL